MTKPYTGLQAVIRKLWKRLPRSWRHKYLKMEASTADKLEEIREKVVRRHQASLHRSRRSRRRMQDRMAARWDRVTAFCEAQKKFLLLGLSGVAMIAIAVCILLGSRTYYEYSYRGQVLGTVKDQRDVYETIELMGDRLSALYGSKVYLDAKEDITFRRVWKGDRVADTPDRILNALSYLQDMKTDAYAIVADGRTLAILETEETAQRILDGLKESYLANGQIYSYIGFAQDVEIKKILTNIGSIQRKIDAEDYLRTGGSAQKIYTVVSGDTFSAIAKRMGMTQKELRALNPDIEINKLKIGQEIILSQVSSLLTVETVSTETYVEEVAYDTVYQETSSLYQGESQVKSKGTNGERQVTAKVTRQNGMVVAAEELESITLKESISQVVLKGTKPVPARIGTGTYIYPTKGTITSKFGTRWGRMHYGVDIANNTGTAIVASDGGKVISAGWENSYGYVVRIDHGANVTTVYAHCSKLLVSVGEKVYQGQKIALMGSTGNSTGPHLHFEVRINGVAKNPLNYLP